MFTNKIIFTIYVLINFYANICAIIYDCSTKNTVFLNLNQIAFFETTNYPQLLSAEKFFDCNVTFILTNATTTHKLFVVSTFIKNQADGAVANYLTNKIYNYTSFSFPPTEYINFDDSSAFQGFLIFEEENTESCPLESISKNEPFMFTNEKQILYIQSSYEKNQYRKRPCKWKFQSPEGYGFKIVIQDFNVSTNAKFRIENSTDLLVNERSINILHPYYNSDNYIQISLSPGDPNFIPEIELKAYVTIVKNTQNKVQRNCTHDEYSLTWTNYNKKFGYENSVYCNFEIIIPPKTEIYVIPDVEGLEKNVDYVRYFPDEFTNVTVVDSNEFILEPYKNGSDRHIFWEFVSDGSLQLIGFQIQFIELSCHCADYHIPCDGTYYYIMNNTNSGYYCGNMECSFKLQPCKSKHTLMKIYSPNGEKLLYDIFTVFSNNEKVMEINNFNRKAEIYNIYLNSLNLNILNVTTFPSPIFKILLFSLESFSVPKIKSFITLSSIDPKYILDTALSEFSVVEISPDLLLMNYSIILYTVIPNAVAIYNNESLTYNLISKNCFRNNKMYECKINSNKFAIWVEENNKPFVVIELPGHQKGCIFPRTTYILYSKPLQYVSAIANSLDDCQITLLLENSIYELKISKLWTTAYSENVKIYSGINETKLLVEFDSLTSNKWKSIQLKTGVYTIKIPKNSALFLTIEKADCLPCFIQEKPYLSLISTPDYGTSKYHIYDNEITNKTLFSIGNYPVKFTVIDYSMDKNDIFYFQSSNSIYRINKTDEFVIFKNQTINLYYSCSNMDNMINGVLFQIETLYDRHL